MGGYLVDFSTRNAVWSGGSRTFLQFNSRSSTPRIWSIQVTGNVISIQWGQQGGVLQEATEVSHGVNHGRSNELSPEAHALELAREKCRKQDRSGYREVDDSGNPLDPEVQKTIDFDNLPPSLCFYKPENVMGASISKKAALGKVLYSRKRNGLAFILARGDGPPKLYSRRMLRQHDDEIGSPWTWDDRFPNIIKAASAVMPENSILLGELVMDRNGQDDFAHVQSLTKSLTPQSQLDQQKGGEVSFYLWDVAFWDGQDMVRTCPVIQRYSIISQIAGGPLLPVQCYDSSAYPDQNAAVASAKALGWEGFVVVDPNGVYGDKGYNFKGKPDRPGAFCAKLKPEWEADFVVMWDPRKGIGEESTRGRYSVGDRPGIKSVALFQHDRNGVLKFISNCSSGMTEAMKRDLADPGNWPRVWEVAYSGRRYISDGDDTNALDFPRFVRDRDDKALDECVDEKL